MANRRRPSPWAQLTQMTNVDVIRRPIAHHGIQGICVPYDDDRWLIVLDTALTQTERSAVLQHELQHVLAGGGCDAPWMPDTWLAVVARDERRIDGQVARRLIPADELAAFVAATHPEPVTAAMIAAHFDVPLWVVERAVA